MSVEGSAICGFENPAYDNSWIITSRKGGTEGTVTFSTHFYAVQVVHVRAGVYVRMSVQTTGHPLRFSWRTRTWRGPPGRPVQDSRTRDRSVLGYTAMSVEKSIMPYGKTVTCLFGGHGTIGRDLQKERASSIVSNKRSEITKFW